MPLSFRAFGQQIDLLLEKNKNLITPNFEVWKRGENDVLKRESHFARPSACHYIYENSASSAAVSLCDTGAVVSAQNEIYLLFFLLNYTNQHFLFEAWIRFSREPQSRNNAAQ